MSSSLLFRWINEIHSDEKIEVFCPSVYDLFLVFLKDMAVITVIGIRNLSRVFSISSLLEDHLDQRNRVTNNLDHCMQC